MTKIVFTCFFLLFNVATIRFKMGAPCTAAWLCAEGILMQGWSAEPKCVLCCPHPTAAGEEASVYLPHARLRHGESRIVLSSETHQGNRHISHKGSSCTGSPPPSFSCSSSRLPQGLCTCWPSAWSTLTLIFTL